MSETKKTQWYKDAVFYQIYPRSFKDSNGDGIGDLKGIIEKLDYLKDLGIDAVWLSPCYKSPNDDNGYDISDYRGIMDEFGTLADWKEMIKGLHKRGIKLVMDLVVNHTSDEHPWFLEAKKSLDNPYRDYYIWSKKPNNWTSRFMGTAWELSPETGEYYLHLFSKKQPDLNWDNPKVRQEVTDICNYWFELGVDGFRCDVITYISKPAGLPDSKYRFWIMRGGDRFVIGPNWQKYIREVSENSWDKYDTMIVGECAEITAKRAYEIAGPGLLDTVISFDHSFADCAFKYYPTKFKLRRLKTALTRWQSLPVWSSVYWENHDQPRVITRYGASGENRVISGKMLANVLMFLRGTPYIYQGQEIGMTNTDFKLEEMQDIMTKGIMNFVKRRLPFLQNFVFKKLADKARDNARTPVQWTAGENAGFSSAEPWMVINKNYTEINVEAEQADENSLWNFYKTIIQVRKNYVNILKNGTYTEFLKGKKHVYCFGIKFEDKMLLTLANFSGAEQIVKLPKDLKFSASELIVSNTGTAKTNLESAVLEPYESATYLVTF